MRKIEPQNLYDAFPNSDLFDFPSPDNATTWAEFVEQTKDCGNALFRHLVLELGEEGLTPEEQDDRLENAILAMQKTHHNLLHFMSNPHF